MYSRPETSLFLSAAFIVIALVVATGFVWLRRMAARRLGESPEGVTRSTATAAVIAVVWLAFSWGVSASGVLARFDVRPPPMAFLFAILPAVSVMLAFSRIGTALVNGLPLWGLVLTQSFRLPLELVMHQAAEDGVMPNQMSYTGANFDIVTGATAILVAWLLATGRAGRGLASAWNVLGALLLLNIVVIAAISTPVIAAFGPDRLNTWVAYPPFIWLPTVMVVAAMIGHLLVWRKLRT